MEFKTRYSNFVTVQIGLAVIAVALAFAELVSPTFHGLLHYSRLFIYPALTFVWLIPVYRTIYADIIGKPFLTVNEEYIYDFKNDIKYYWRDIESIDATLPFLYINLYKPEEYLTRIRNPHRRYLNKRWFKSGKEKSVFVINLDFVYEDELIEILNDYSIKAEKI